MKKDWCLESFWVQKTAEHVGGVMKIRLLSDYYYFDYGNRLMWLSLVTT